MGYLSILIPIISTATFVVFQVLIFKTVFKSSLLKSIYLGFVCGLLVFAACEAVIFLKNPSERVPILLANFIIYGCLAFSYFTFINMGETARRIRILRELHDSALPLTKLEILAKYSAKQITAIRLGRLLNNKQVILKNGRYYIGSPVMLIFSKLILILKLIICGKSSEFDK